MLLPLHIAGGLLSLLAAGGGFYVSLRPSGSGRFFIVAIPLLAGWQLVTGFLLLLEGASGLRLCISAVVYLAIMGWIELRLLYLSRESEKV